MSIGLTADQLGDTFLRCLQIRMNEFAGELQAMKAGESPDRTKALSDFLAKFPTITVEQIASVFILFMALMDTIASNNVALAKVIPHVEV